MRVYVPATIPLLADLLAAGTSPPPVRAYAVTELLTSWADRSGPSDDDELELVALSEAARGSLRLLAADPAGVQRRVVLAIDVPDAAVRVDEGSSPGTPGQVVVDVDLPLAWLRAVHVDDPVAGSAVHRAAAAVAAADADDDTAEAVVTGADEHDLLWYAPDEVADLLRDARAGVNEGREPR